MAMGDENAGTGDPELRLAVGEALKAFRGLEASPLYNIVDEMAKAAQRSAVANRNENRKEGKESNKEKDADNNRTGDVR